MQRRGATPGSKDDNMTTLLYDMLEAEAKAKGHDAVFVWDTYMPCAPGSYMDATPQSPTEKLWAAQNDACRKGMRMALAPVPVALPLVQGATAEALEELEDDMIRSMEDLMHELRSEINQEVSVLQADIERLERDACEGCECS